MAYDYSKNRMSHGYEDRLPMYSAPSVHNNQHHVPFYPRVGQPSSPAPRVAPVIPSLTRSYSPHQTAPSSHGVNIRVAIKPEYGITPPPQLLPQIEDIRGSTFQFDFDFDFERKILAEAEKENPNWNRIAAENHPTKVQDSTTNNPALDPIVAKYVASGIPRETARLAVANYGDNPTKVEEFAKGFCVLCDMGFSEESVAEALVVNENDTDKALSHMLKSA